MVNSKETGISLLVNQTINLIYTVIFFSPVIIVWFRFYHSKLLFVSLGVSLIPFFLPTKTYRYFQLSRKRRFYQKLLIDKFQHFTQEGYFVKQLVNSISKIQNHQFNKSIIKKLTNQIRAFESYHLACLLFFLFTFIYALIKREYFFAFAIFISNVLYNIIPILIQQYNKTRISCFFK